MSQETIQPPALINLSPLHVKIVGVTPPQFFFTGLFLLRILPNQQF
jgi:hypothetical protein